MWPFKNKRLKSTDVFTPTKPATHTYVERSAVNTQIHEALDTPGMQIILYGHSGCGKTTLIHNILKTRPWNQITTRCTKKMTYDQIILDAFDQLSPFVTTKRIFSKVKGVQASTSTSYASIKASVKATMSESKGGELTRVLPPQLTPNRLANFLGAANCCWVLEDFHKVATDEKVNIAQIMKIFMDMSVDYEHLKIIAIGAVDTARQVIECDPELQNRVSEINIPLMSDHEIHSIIKLGGDSLSMSFEPALKNMIVEYSNGLASICHQLCLNICFNMNIRSTVYRTRPIDIEELEPAVKKYVTNSSDTMKDSFTKALAKKRKQTYHDCELILRDLVRYPFNDGANFNEILDSIKEKYKQYATEWLEKYLLELQNESRGNVLRFDGSTGKYQYENPFFYTFAKSLFTSERPKKRDKLEWPTGVDRIYKFSDLHDLDSQFDTISNIWTDFLVSREPKFLKEYSVKVPTEKKRIPKIAGRAKANPTHQRKNRPRKR
jgi:hypothetical protein